MKTNLGEIIAEREKRIKGSDTEIRNVELREEDQIN